MKKTTLFLVLMIAARAVVAGVPFVYENAYELQAGGDFDGDGRADLLIVDKTTGDYRIGYQLSAGAYTWVSPRASGIAGACGLGIGRLDSTNFDSLAVAGPDANRVNILDATNTSAAGLPVSVFIPSLGPSLSTVLDLSNGLPDLLYVASLYNGISAYRETILSNSGGTNQTATADNGLSYLRQRGNAVLLHTNRHVFLAAIDRQIGAGCDVLKLLDLSSGSSAVSVAGAPITNVPQPADYVTGQFAVTNPYTEFIGYSPTGTNLWEYQVTEPTSGNYALGLSNSFALADAIDRIFALPGTNGTKLLVLYVNDTAADALNFDGVHAPTVAQHFTAAAGEHFTGAGVLGNSGFMAYSAPVGQNTSTRFYQWTWSGSGYSNSASGNLPFLSTYSASGNVMQFQFEPFVTNNPVLLRLNNAGDWSEAPVFSGGNIRVQTESFLGATLGLGNPTSTVVGKAHPLAAFGLANQYSNMISLFSFNQPAGDKISDVTISPPAGTYQTTIQISLVAANASDAIFFRVGGGAWALWTNGMIVNLFTNCSVQYYGQPTDSVAKSAVNTAAYSITSPPSTLDSNHDGIPDYVKIALGLNLTGSGDSDGDGYSDLEELIHGTDPLSTNSVPTNWPHLDDQAVFNLQVTPWPLDGIADAPTRAGTNAQLHAYDLQGELQTSVMISNNWPAGVLTNIPIVVEERLISVATDPNYAIITTNADTNIGREMIELVPMPDPTFPTVPYTYGSSGGDLMTEASAWIAAASNLYNNLHRTVLTNTLTMNNTLEALLFEQEIAGLFSARGNAWWSNVTLFPFRISDAGRTNPSMDMMLSLEYAAGSVPGYKLQTAYGVVSNLVENSGVSGAANLSAVVQDIYRIDGMLNNSNPAKFASPVDEVRFFLWRGGFDTNYLPYATTTNQFAAASNAASLILAAIPPRPTTNVLLSVRSDTLTAPCRILDRFGGGTTFALVDSNNAPFVFPNNFQLLPGSVVFISGYTDASNTGCAYPAIEVASAALSSVPIATDTDTDGNLLIDSWEQRFFGATGIDPFADSDGDGYCNLQEMLDGSDPRDPNSIPSNPPVHFGPPPLALVPVGEQMELHFIWPSAYVGDFAFGVRHSADLVTPFADLPVSGPVSVLGDEFKITFTAPSTEAHFYYLTVSLR